MSAELVYFVSSLAAAAVLEGLARHGPEGFRPWARGMVLWSGMLWAGFALFALVALVSGGEGLGDEPLRSLGARTWLALLIGSGFFVFGHAAALLAQTSRLPRWARHGATLLSAMPGVLIGYVVYRLLMLAFFSEAPFWRQPDSIAQIFDTLTLWLLANAALVAGLVRMLYDVRLDAVEARQSRLEAEVTAARLAALEARLRPHALLNALGGLAGLIRTDPDAAEAMTLGLARMLRRTLDVSDTPLVALADELALAEDTLAVERHRLGDRLRVTVDAAPATRGLAVPRLVLQPLVENAVKHGAARTTEPVHVAVRAVHRGDRLRLEVEDDGPAFAEGWTGGVGLTSVTERLRLIYGDDASLRIEVSPKRVVLDLPVRPDSSRPAPAAR